MSFCLLFCCRVGVPRGAGAGLLPGPAGLLHLPDHTHGVVGGVQRRLRLRLLLRQPAHEEENTHLRVQRRLVLQRGGGEDRQVWLHGVHVDHSTTERAITTTQQLTNTDIPPPHPTPPHTTFIFPPQPDISTRKGSNNTNSADRRASGGLF